MKVYDLGCERDHRFEGWFGSAADFDDQCARGLVECPLCGSRSIRKLLSAPRLNLSSATADRRAADEARSRGGESATQAVPAPRGPEQGGRPAASPGAPAELARLQALWMRMARHVMANTEDVGARFAEEARRIHHGEARERGIRGVATPQQAAELADEGIEVLALPLPAAAKETLQ